MQPEKVAEVRGWFLKVEDDLAAAQVDLAANPPLLGDAVFHCQQAAEKALKGFLTWHDKPFRKSHDIRKIGRGVLDVDPSLEAVIHRAIVLTPFAGVFRYPSETDTPTPAEATAALELAREVYQEILRRLPDEVRS